MAEVLLLSFNNIESIVGFNAQFLTELDISHNQIKEFRDVSMPHLRYLNASHNELTSIDVVQQLPSLRMINAV